MVKIAAGILMYCFKDGKLKVFLGHPGGPFFAGKDVLGIPKGEVNSENGENEKDLLSVAIREFEEETGIMLTGKEKFTELGFVKNSFKKIYVWAFHGTGKEKFVKSNSFEMEWPLKSGEMKSFPESDAGKYFDVGSARKRIHKSQREFLDRLEDKVGAERTEIRKDKQGKLF